MKRMNSLIPDAETLIALPQPELAAFVLEVLLSAEPSEAGVWNRTNFCMEVGRAYGSPHTGPLFEAGLACSSAWSWLESNGFIAAHPEQASGWHAPTERGRALRTAQNLREHLAGDRLAAADLHPELLIHTRPLYLQARFETAVFEAFKALEVAIREAAQLGHDLVGVPLASKAFQPDSGPLTDPAVERGEQVAFGRAGQLQKPFLAPPRCA